MTPEATVVPKLWNLPDAIRSRLGREAGPQRAMLEEGHLLIVLHQLPEPNELTRRAALFWRQPNGEWRSGLGGAPLAVLQAQLDAYHERLVQLEAAENKASSASDYHSVLEQLSPVVRSARGLHRALQQARELLKSEHSLVNFRDQAAGVERNAELLLLAALFLPLTALASVFGMEIHSHFLDTPANFWLICLAGLSAGLILSGLLVRRPR